MKIVYIFFKPLDYLCKIDYILAMECMADKNKAIYKAIARNIVLRRKDLKYTQEKVGLVIGKSRSYIANLENCRIEIPVYVLYQLADFFECNVYDLMPSNYADLAAPPVESEVPVSAHDKESVLNALKEVHDEVSKE